MILYKGVMAGVCSGCLSMITEIHENIPESKTVRNYDYYARRKLECQEFITILCFDLYNSI